MSALPKSNNSDRLENYLVRVFVRDLFFFLSNLSFALDVDDDEEEEEDLVLLCLLTELYKTALKVLDDLLTG